MTSPTDYGQLRNRRMLISFVVVFAAIGASILLAVHASTPTASIEAENGVITGNASVTIDTTASNGAAVTFGAGSSSCPTGPAGSLAVHVCGNQLTDASGNILHLHGVNLSVTETACAQDWTNDPYGGLPLANATVYQKMTTWKVNILRIPLNEDCWLNVNLSNNQFKSAGAAYQSAIQQEVTLAHQAGLYVILDLHWSAPGTQVAIGQNYAPDEDHSVSFWQSVATTFKNDPGVIFDIYNEPIYDWISSTGWTCYLVGCTATRYYSTTGNDVQGTWQVAGFNQLISTIRATGATQPVLTNGLLWGNDDTQWLTHVPTDPIHQLIAGAHIYPGQNDGLSSTVTSQRPAQWDQVYTPIGAQYPILVGETGDVTTAPVNYLPTFLPYAQAHNWNYLAWTWDAWSDPNDVLLQKVTNDANDYLNPTPNSGEGACYMNWLVSGHCP